MSDLMKEILRKTSKMPPPSFAFKAPKGATSSDDPDCSPIGWEGYYDSQICNEDGFVIYRASPKSLDEKFVEDAPYIFLLHGAGYTSLSWCLVVEELKNFAHVVAYDFRGHGGTRTVDNDEDFSSKTLSTDSAQIITQVINADQEKVKASCGNEFEPKLVIVGHSMGGAIAAKTAALVEKSWLRGLILIDIVEGSALAALPSMHRILAQRPTTFQTPSDAILWARKSRTVLNTLSARISVPSQIVPFDDPKTGKQIYRWRANLNNTEPYWREWYEGLSKLFLSISAPKLLLLSGADILDQELTVGQMQGKFQMSLIPQAGHVIQEDAPQDTAQILLGFMKRQKLFGKNEPPISISSRVHRDHNV